MGKSVVVVGGGVVGLCSALYLRRRGHRVTVIERGGPHDEGCSFGNAGFVVPSHLVPLAAPGMVARGVAMMFRRHSPFYIRPRIDRDLADWCWRFYRSSTRQHVARAAPLLRNLSLASRTCYEELAAEAGNDFGLEKRGLLMLCRGERALAEERHTVDLARRLGVAAEMVTTGDIVRLEPRVRIEAAGGVYFADDCHLSPNRLMAGLARRLEDEGVRVAWNTHVDDWRIEGRRVAAVVIGGGSMEADWFVLAGGAWTGLLARKLALRLPMQAGKGYSVTLPGARVVPSRGLLLVEARVAVTPIGDALRIGGTLELCGLDDTIDTGRVSAMIDAAVEYLPDYAADDFRRPPVWRGLRPCTPDGLPYVGRPRRYDNLCVAAGHAMLGVSLGPITGRLVAEVVGGEPPSVGMELLRPDRFEQRW
jgi:D-amino-acid dehydrogenase